MGELVPIIAPTWGEPRAAPHPIRQVPRGLAHVAYGRRYRYGRKESSGYQR
jgi:hypothetical protein